MLRKLNRIKSKTVRTKKSFYCFGCDRNHVTARQKCSVCGHIENKKKIFKHAPLA